MNLLNNIDPNSELANQLNDLKNEAVQSITAGSPSGVSNSANGIMNIISGLRRLKFKSLSPNAVKSGDWGLENVRLDSGASFTSFNDANVNSSGHSREYYLSLTGDITEDNTISIGLSNTNYEIGAANSLLARTHGVNFSWIHNINDNYSIGGFGLYNNIDIEEINANTYSYAYGILFLTYHSFDYFDISTATALSHADYDVGNDQQFLTSITLSKALTDSIEIYGTFTFIDSFAKDPDTDATYGIGELGGVYTLNETISISVAYSKTVFFKNYRDNTISFNLTWNF